MENFLLSFNVVAPLMLYMLIGITLNRTKLIDASMFRIFNRVVFYVVLPAVCMKNIMNSDLSAMASDRILLWIAFGIFGLFLLSMLFVPLFCKDNRRRGVLVQCIFRSNDAIFGLAVGAALVGQDNLGIISIGVALSVPLYNVFGVIAMERFRGGKARLGFIALSILKNPIIIGCLLGFALNLLHVRFPTALQTAVNGVCGLSTPLAFIILGGTLSLKSLSSDRRTVAVVTLLRLIIIPLTLVTGAVLCGFRGESVILMLCIFGAPVAMTSYSMACAMGGDENLAAESVVVSSLLSVLTMFLFIFVLKQMGVI